MEDIDPERGTDPRKAVPGQTLFTPLTWRHDSGDAQDAGDAGRGEGGRGEYHGICWVMI